MFKKLCAVVAVACSVGLGAGASAQGWVQIADSVTDFSSTQGQNGWWYGYAISFGQPATVTMMANYTAAQSCGCGNVGAIWHFAPGVCFCSQEFCFQGATGAHPDGHGEPHVPVRRYVLPASGRYLLQPSFSHGGGCQAAEDIRLELRFRGAVIWSASTDGGAQTGSIEIVGNAGEFVELWSVMLLNECGTYHEVSMRVSKAIANVLPPQEWKVSLGGNGHWYGVYTTSYNWWSATAYARGIGAHLASFNSLAEGEACENLTVNYHQSGPGDYWLGGIQEDTGAEPGGGWRWVYNEAFVPDWRSGEPNNQGDEDCLILNLTSTVGNEIDGACSSSARAIFEWDADCNRDGIVDYGQIMSGAIADTNGNFIPDSCEGAPYGAVEWPTAAGGNGHWYGYSPSGGFNADVTWAAAHHAHLVTWQTLAERTFIEFSLLGMGLGTYRTGAHQDPEGLEPAGGWGWHNGEPWNASVAGWQVGHPANTTGAEDCMIIKRSSSSALPDPYNQSRDCDEVNSSLIEWDADCNHDGLVDFGQIVRGELSDVDGDYLPDVCDCADIIIDGEINGVDLAALLGAWGSSGGANNADVSGDGIVNGADLSLVLAGWGACVSVPAPPSWATVLEWPPNPAVVTDAAFRTRMLATGLPWRVLDNASGIEMLLVPPGTFMMGASPGDSEAASDESPAHQVTLTNAFYLGRTEVTQETWLAEMGSNPSGFTGDLLRPVEFVSWAAIQPFCSQNGLRLPTEAEWEYACRGGNLTSRYGPVGNIAWYTTNSSNQTHTVGTKLPNALGIYDMIGNVWEWSQDWYGPYSATSVTNPTGPASGAYRTPRGGTYMASTAYCRASVRGGVPGTAGQHIGFRVARNP